MKKSNPFKIYLLAIFHLIMPKWIKHKFHYKATGLEHIAIGVAMNKIKYWRHFIKKEKFDKTIKWRNQEYNFQDK
jgi:hypothetical protein